MKKAFQILNIFSSIAFALGVLLTMFFVTPATNPIWNILHDKGQVIILVVLFAGLVSLILSYISSNSSSFAQVLYVTRDAERKEVIDHETIVKDGQSDYSGIRKELDRVVAISDQDVNKVEKILSAVCNGLQAGQGIVYKKEEIDSKVMLRTVATYATVFSGEKPLFEVGEGLVGLAVKENRRMEIANVPDGYIKIFSGLGKSTPKVLIIIPVSKGDEVVGALEIAFFSPLDKNSDKVLNECVSKISQFI